MQDLTPTLGASRVFLGLSVKPEHFVSPATAPSDLWGDAQDVFGDRFSHLAVGQQIHKTHLERIDAAPDSRLTIFPNTDGFITRVPGVALGIFTADCTAACLYDSATHTLGMAHAGWRGTYEDILPRLVSTLIHAYHADPRTCVVHLGPAIGKSCYEVSADMADLFLNNLPLSRDYLAPGKPGKYFLDLRGLQRAQLMACGISEERIHLSPACTHCETDTYFSYRRTKELAGRHLTIGVLL